VVGNADRRQKDVNGVQCLRQCAEKCVVKERDCGDNQIRCVTGKRRPDLGHPVTSGSQLGTATRVIMFNIVFPRWGGFLHFSRK
jgi:hypothetical protein